MSQFCDVVYVIWAERVDRLAHAALAGDARIEPQEWRDEFDAWLMSPLKVLDPEVAELNRALGVGKWRR